MRKSCKTAAAVAVATALAAAIMVVPAPGKARAAETYTVSPYVKYQEIDGWGSSLIWWAGQVGGYDREGDDGREVREQIMDLIYGHDGLDFNIARYNVGGGENPDCPENKGAETHMQKGRNMEGYKVYENGEYNWDADANQRWVLEWIYAHRDDVITEYFSNSPPWWMTISGCVSGLNKEYRNSTENLKPEYEDDFALYFVDVLEHLIKEEGYQIDYVNPFNESTSKWWGLGGSQEGCYFNDEQRTKVLDEVARLCIERGLDVKIAAEDSTGAGSAYAAYSYLRTHLTDDAKGMIGKLNYHLYEQGELNKGDRAARAQMRHIADKDGVGKVWMSEMGYEGKDHLIEGSMETAFIHSSMIRDTLNFGGVNAYVLWQIVEELASQIGATGNYGPIKVSFYDRTESSDLANNGLYKGSYEINKQYYVLGQYSKYIKAGYTLTKSTDSNAVVAVSPAGDKVVIVRENQGDAQSVRYAMDGYAITGGKVVYTDPTHSWTEKPLAASGTAFDYDLTAESVTTFVLDTVPLKTDRVFIDDENPLFVFDNGGGTGDGVWKKDNGEAIATVASTHYLKGSGVQTVSITFTDATEIAAYGLKKSDAGSISYAVDGGASTTVDLKQDTRACDRWFAVGGLDPETEHTLVITAAGGWINFDGVTLANGQDSAYTAPTLRTASANSEKLAVSFAGEENAAYTVEYMPIGGTWETVAVDTGAEGNATYADGVYAVTVDGTFAGDYFVRVSTGTSHSETMAVSPITVGNLLYYVDAGASTGYTQFEKAGKYNSYKDGADAVDPLTGMRWGRTSAGNEMYANGTVGSPYRAAQDVVSADGNADNKIEYVFTFDEETAVDIAISLVVPSNWGARPTAVAVNGGAPVKYDTTAGEVNVIFLKNVAVVDNTVTLTVTHAEKESEPGTYYDNPMIGSIMIAAAGTKQAMYATLGGMEQVAGDLYRLLPDTQTLAYGEAPDLSDLQATVVYTDGTFETAETVFDPLVVTGTEANGVMAAITGTAGGLRFAGELVSESASGTYYYRIDCGGNDSSFVPGTKQGGVADQQSTDENTWGWMECDGNAWATDPYDNSIRYANTRQLRYRITGLTPGEMVEVTVASCSVWGWHGNNSRDFNVYLRTTPDYSDLTAESDDYIGNIHFNRGEDGAKPSVKGRVTANEDGTIYVIAYNTATSNHPQLSWITVMGGSFSAAPAAPTVDKTEAGTEDVIHVGGLVDGGVMLVTNERNELLYSEAVSGAATDLDLGDLDLTGSSFLRITQRTETAAADSAAVGISLPRVNVVGLKEGWASERLILHMSPSAGVTFQKLLITDPNGTTTNITDNEYYHYRAYQNGEYTLTFTTRNNVTYTQTFELSNIDCVTVESTLSTTGWTDGDVTVTLTPTLTEAIRELYIDDVLQPVQNSYAVTVQENRTVAVKVVTVTGREIDFPVVVGNIDKGTPGLTLTPDLTFLDGVKLDYAIDGISGGTVTVTKGDDTYAVGTGIRLFEAGTYAYSMVSGTGKSIEGTVKLTYSAGDLSLATVSLADGKLTVSAANGATVKVAFGGAELGGAGEYTADKTGRYIVYAMKDGAVEALVIDNAVTDPATPETPTDSGKKGCGCGSAVSGSAAVIGLLLIALAAVVFTKRARA